MHTIKTQVLSMQEGKLHEILGANNKPENNVRLPVFQFGW